MNNTTTCALGAISLFLLLSLLSCGTAPTCKPIMTTQTVDVYRDRYVTVDPALIAKEPAPPWPAAPLIITNKVLDGHDSATTQALARANGKFDVLRCAGIAGVNGMLAEPCPTLPPVADLPKPKPRE